MPVSVKVGGAWKTATNVYNKVGGVWKTAADMPVKVGGVWKTGILIQGAYESIATINGTGGANTFTFSSIPQTYKSLQLRMVTNDANGYVPSLRFNGDTSSNYARHSISGNGSTVSVTGTNSQTVINLVTPNSVSSDNLSAYVIDIVDYSSTSKNKTVRSFSGSSGNIVCLHSGLWLSTAAVTSITISTNQPFSSSSRFSLYGIKG